jgi:putative flippase GtrA
VRVTALLLIPAYQPGAALVTLVEMIRAADSDIAVVAVDDGSGSDYDDIFGVVKGLGCDVVRYPDNSGKGHALKTGFDHIARRYPDHDVVCADGDGQHAVADILRVADRLRRRPDAMVLGTRRFTGEVPARSRWGNAASGLFFRLATGRNLPDVQTGLRGYPATMLTWLRSIPGERYEYEHNLLLRAVDAGLTIDTVDIATIYVGANESSHFRPLADSIRIYAPVLLFAASSMVAFAIDTVALLALSALTGSLILSVVGARALSSAVNFVANSLIVFEHGRNRPSIAAAAQYFCLVAGLLAINYCMLLGLQFAGVPLLPAKLLTELALFAISYAVQRRVVFADPYRRRTVQQSFRSESSARTRPA